MQEMMVPLALGGFPCFGSFGAYAATRAAAVSTWASTRRIRLVPRVLASYARISVQKLPAANGDGPIGQDNALGSGQPREEHAEKKPKATGNLPAPASGLWSLGQFRLDFERCAEAAN